jgi:hypothetical protein
LDAITLNNILNLGTKECINHFLAFTKVKKVLHLKELLYWNK